MGEQLIAVIAKSANGAEFRVASKKDEDAVEQARVTLSRDLNTWIHQSIVPDDEISGPTNYDRGHKLYGKTHCAISLHDSLLLSRPEHGIFAT